MLLSSTRTKGSGNHICQILFSETANPPNEVIKYANKNNSHGFGFAYVKGNKVVWDKGYAESQLEEKLEYYLSLPFPKAIHFRLATHGGISSEMCHPFPIKRGVPHALDGEADSVLFHNGIWHSYNDRLRECIFAGTLNPNVMKGGMSDSRAMAVLCQRFGENILDILDIDNQKVLVLRYDTWYRYGNWTKRDGWWASNSNVEGSKRSEARVWTHNRDGSATSHVRVVDHMGIQQSMYLDGNKEEIESVANSWQRRMLE